MRKLLITGIILLVFIGGIAFLLMNLNNIINKNKQIILAQAEEVLQRKIDVGDIGISLWPGIGLSLANISLSDDPSFSSGDFLRASSLHVNVRLFPLLQKDLQVRKILLYDPVITIIRNEKGQYNFESIAQKGDKGKKPVKPGTPDKPLEDEEKEVFSLLVSLVNIKNGDIRYMDKTVKGLEEARIQDLDLEVGDIGFEHPMKIKLSAKVLEAEEQNIVLEGTFGPWGRTIDLAKTAIEGKIKIGPLDVDKFTKAFPWIAKQIPAGTGLTGPINLQAHVAGTGKALQLSNIDLSASVFGARETNLKIKEGKISSLGPEISYQDLKFKAQVELTPVILENLMKFAPLQKALPANLKAAGPVSLRTDVNGSLQKLHIAASLEASQSSIELNKDVQKPKGVPLSVSLKCQMEKQEITCPNYQFQLHKLKGKGSGKVIMDKVPSLDMTFDSENTDLAGWDQILATLKDYDLSGTLDLQTHIAGVINGKKIPYIKGKLDLSGVSARLAQLDRKIEDINASISLLGDTLELKETSLRWGSSPLKIKARLQNFAKPILTYELSSPALKPADFLAPESAKQLQEDVLRGVDSKGRIEMAGEKIRYQGRINAPNGTIQKIDLQNIESILSLNNQVATVDKLNFVALDGSFRGQGKYSFQDPQNLLFDFNTEISGMNLKKLLAAVYPSGQETLVGKLRLDLQIAGKGQEWKTIQNTLSGKGKAEIQDGALLNMNIPETVLTNTTGVPGLSALISQRINRKYAHLFEAKDTRFEQLNGSFLIDKGQIQIKDLILTSTDFTIESRGWIGLDKRVDLSANLIMGQQFSKDVMDDIKETKYIANEENRLEFPFRISGNVPHLKPKPDVAYLTKKMQKAFIQKGVEKLFEKIVPPEKKSAPPAEGEQAPSASAPSQEKAKPEDIIRKTLEGILGR